MKNKFCQNLIANNANWIRDKKENDPQYFEKLAIGQAPKYLMIGCSDSRVPLSSMFNAEPGEIFIHRNVANQVGMTDMNLQTVLEYSVEHLHVGHIAIVGHYRCGGVAAAVDAIDEGLLENWVAPIKDLYLQNRDTLDLENHKQASLDKLSRINVLEQAKNVFRTPIMQRAFERGKYPRVYGLIFDIYTGKIEELDLPIDEWKVAGIIPSFY